MSATQFQFFGDSGALGSIAQLAVTIVSLMVFFVVLHLVVKAAVKNGMREAMAEKQASQSLKAHASP